jgi:hypothetical protein
MLRSSDGYLKGFFDDIHDVKPEDGLVVRYDRDSQKVDLTPAVGVLEKHQILFCPTAPGSLTRYEPGTIGRRVDDYMQSTGHRSDVGILVGTAGSYCSTSEYGEAILPKKAYTSCRHRQQSDVQIEHGIFSDDVLRQTVIRESRGSLNPVYNVLTLEDVDEVISQTSADKLKRYQEGFYASDMESAPFQAFCGVKAKPACTVLVITDLVGDRPFTDVPKVMGYSPDVIKNSIQKAVEAAVDAIFGWHR